jgi:hypothetical protein
MSPEEVVATLAALAGPQGPWTSEAQVGKLRQELLAGDPATATSRLLSAVALQAPLPASVPVTWTEVAAEAADLMSVLAEDVAAHQLLVHALHDAAVRTVALEAMALLASPASSPALAQLAAEQMEHPFLDEDELIHLASALGSAGSAEARAAVELLRSHSWGPAVDRELEIALQAIRG